MREWERTIVQLAVWPEDPISAVQAAQLASQLWTLVHVGRDPQCGRRQSGRGRREVGQCRRSGAFLE